MREFRAALLGGANCAASSTRPAARGADRIRLTKHVQLVLPEFPEISGPRGRGSPPGESFPPLRASPACISARAPSSSVSSRRASRAIASPVIAPCINSGTTARPAIKFTME